jgi:2,4-dienoyl-CoA reductase-like NADH-dependent reductase (Old Yellow Enzyme family)
MIFKKLKINKIQLKNRIVVSPMCQYSAKNGCPTTWHYNHLSKLANSGAGMLMLESTAVNNNGKITHFDLCLNNDHQEKKFLNLKKYINKSSDVPIGIQISHSGRKGSSWVPWIKTNMPLNKNNNSWQTYSASSIKRDNHWPKPKELQRKNLNDIFNDFKNTAKRAKRIGFECLELHMAHGYLLHQFLSPISNKREDEYGIKKEIRLNYPLKIAKGVRKIWPKDKILGARITATDCLEEGIKIKDSIKLVKELKKIGFDYVCVSSGGILPITNMKVGKAFRRNLSKEIKKKTSILTRVSGEIDSIKIAESMLINNHADFVAVGRKFINDPNWLINEAKKRKIKGYIANQYLRCI